MKKLFVLYDSNCAFCCQCRRWLEQQASYFELHFVPAHSEEAKRLVPDVEKYEVVNELTVIGDDGAVYQGPQAFIMCLYALVEFREWSLRLAEPALLPFARQTFNFISNHRKIFSQWMRRATDDELAATLQYYPPPLCGNEKSSCLLVAKQNALRR